MEIIKSPSHFVKININVSRYVISNMLLELNEFDKVVGEIYKITNTATNKCYIGQTRSHRLNRKKYRPFGYLGRFKDHIHEAFSNKKNVSRYLNSSIRKYGSDIFKCELLLTCKVDKMDLFETNYISEFNTKFPHGYNLTDGGKTFSKVKPEIKLQQFVREKSNLKKSDETKLLMSKRGKEARADINVRKNMMKLSQNQHSVKKFERFKNVTVDKTNYEKYIHIIRNNKLNYEYVRVIIGKVRTNFVGKFEETT